VPRSVVPTAETVQRLAKPEKAGCMQNMRMRLRSVTAHRDTRHWRLLQDQEKLLSKYFQGLARIVTSREEGIVHARTEVFRWMKRWP
jgi:hypothetical protein